MNRSKSRQTSRGFRGSISRPDKRKLRRLSPGWMLGVGGAIFIGCASPPGTPIRLDHVQPIRISHVLDHGDATRRASIRLVSEGLEADIAGEHRRAQGSYERAIQVDPTNPYAFLSLARHHLDGGDPQQASFLIDQAAALFDSEGMAGPEVSVHLMGLRGVGFLSEGRESDAALYLQRANALAPIIWGDGSLSADELR